MRWLIPRWPAFQAKHPDRDIHLVAGGGAFSFNTGIYLVIRYDDFPLPDGYHAEYLFSEKVGPVCRPDNVVDWFSPAKNGMSLHTTAPRLHSRTRLSAWQTRSSVTQYPFHDNNGQTFEHFYFSLQAAVAGFGVAIGPWQLVRYDIASGVLAAPLWFVEEGSCYCLLSPYQLFPDTFQIDILSLLRAMA
ncbi:LysR substrate-binding domain-containing protein [Candidatus Symbiopectobacterium sp.]|uniref:LysR substrate-binding domain-containing protein n=1 Tax=Candidatus Symbiopectobacterium sp. TaxID=2816440 RepID=UPI0025C1C0D6|nr:LysR substrate-binding domain-containing protein [Candidatus Symbiopectobacterium sp.]